VPVEGADQPVGLPYRRGFGVRARPPGNAGEIPPRTDPGRPVATPGGVGEQVPVHGCPHLVSYMQTDGFGQVIAHPPAGLDMRLRGGLDSFARQPQPLAQSFRIGAAFMAGGQIRATARCGITLHRAAQPKHRRPLALHPSAHTGIADVEFQADHGRRPFVFEIGGLRLTAPPRHDVTANRGVGVNGRGCHRPDETITHRHRPATTPVAKPSAANRSHPQPGSHHLSAGPPASGFLLAPAGPGRCRCRKGCCWC
jgi:hypothetical protein